MEIIFTDVENKRWKKFQNKHSKCSKNSGVIGGNFKFIITPTSIGNFIEVECCKCKKIKDITDEVKI